MSKDSKVSIFSGAASMSQRFVNRFVNADTYFLVRLMIDVDMC